MTGPAHIPAEAIDPLRDGLRSRLAGVARAIADRDGTIADERTEHDRADLCRLDALRALLDELGWDTPPCERAIDPQAHGWALREALRDQLAVHADMLRELRPNDGSRAAIARRAGTLQKLADAVGSGAPARWSANR